MLKKHKILILVIALTAGGIVTVLSIWLYGSYKNRQELFMGTAERLLFNVLQEYYQSEISDNRTRSVNDSSENEDRHRYLISFVGKVYPGVDLSKLQEALDTTDFRRNRQRRIRQGEQRREDPHQLLPLYLLEKITFSEKVLDVLETRLAKSLNRNRMATDFELFTKTISKNEFDNYYRENWGLNPLVTRPILVNPENEQFLVAKFQAPWSYLFVNLIWQILFSILLLVALIGTFLYLLRTIKRQNELALQRKSFVNNMTHELKTPVATVMAAVEAIQRFGAKGDKSRMDKYLDVSKHELEHLSDMIERVLQMDFDETNGVRLIKKDFDLVQVVHSCIETAQMGAQKPVDIDFQYPEHAIIIHADESHIKNVISNLLDNAIKYSGEEAYIRLKLQIEGQKVEIRVQDHGKGIDKSHQKNIFDMFYRVTEGNIHEVKGFGLGLAYVKQVIQQHGGSVEIESKLGDGSTFIVYIPKN